MRESPPCRASFSRAGRVSRYALLLGNAIGASAQRGVRQTVMSYYYSSTQNLPAPCHQCLHSNFRVIVLNSLFSASRVLISARRTPSNSARHVSTGGCLAQALDCRTGHGRALALRNIRVEQTTFGFSVGTRTLDSETAKCAADPRFLRIRLGPWSLVPLHFSSLASLVPHNAIT